MTQNQDISTTEMTVNPEKNDNKYIVFSLNKENLSLKLNLIQEVIEVKKIRPIPRLSAKFEGIYFLRGEIVPILNLNYCIFNTTNLDKTVNQSEKRVVVFNYLQGIFGFIVDEIHDIVELEEDHFNDIPTAIESKIPLDFIEKIASINNKIIKIISIGSIFRAKFSVEHGDAGFSTENMIEEQVMDKTQLILNHQQLDALKEVSNIASGNAVTALSKMFQSKVKISIQVEDVKIADLIDLGTEGFNASEIVVGIRSIMKNDLHGVIFCIFSLAELKFLLKEIDNVKTLPDNVYSISDINKVTLSAIQEIGNIIISHYCSGISDFLKLKIYHNVPEVALGEYFAILDSEISKLAAYSDQAILMKTEMGVKDHSISGSMIFIPYYESIDKFVEYLNPDKIVQQMDSSVAKKSLKSDKNVSDKPKSAKKTPIKPSSVKKTSKKPTSTKKTIGKPTSNDSSKKKEASKNKSSGSKSKNESTEKKLTKEIFSHVEAQSSFKLDKKVKEELKIEELDLNAFQELGNIAAGNAGNALSQILNKKVYLEIPPAKVLDLPDFIKSFGSSEKKIGVLGITSGFFESNIFLMFSAPHTLNLLNEVMDSDTKKKLRSKSDLTSAEESAIREISNILMGHYISATSDFLKIKIEPPKYQFFFQDPRKLFEKLSKTAGNKNLKAIIIETLIDVAQDAKIDGQFILILSPKVVKNVLTRVAEIWDI
jgi:chemotaxis protein CheC